MTLEHRIKLWNHLATHGNLMLSSAWYGTQEQAEMWWKISEAEFADPNSNANKEIRLLERVLSSEEMQKEFQHAVYIIDVGSGTGEKASALLRMLPTQEIFYLPLDSSMHLLEDAEFMIHEQAHEDGFEIHSCSLSSDLGEDPLQTFVQKLLKSDYRGAFKPSLRGYENVISKLRELIDSKYVQQVDIEVQANDYPKKPSMPVKEMLLKGLSHAQKHKLALEESIEDIYSQDSSQDRRSAAMSLRQKYDPFILMDFRGLVDSVESHLEIRYAKNMKTLHGHPTTGYVVALAGGVCEYLEELPTDGGPRKKFEKTKRDLILSKTGMVTDIMQGSFEELELLLGNHSLAKGIPKMVTFLGHTLGNFTAEHQQTLINRLADIMKQGDALVLGVELGPRPDNPRYKERVQELLAKYGASIEGKQDSKPDKFLRHTTGLLGIPDDALRFNVSWKDNAVHMGYTVVVPEFMGYTVVVPELRIPHPTRKGEDLCYKKGKQILTGRSYKFAIKELQELLTGAGLKLQYSHDTAESYWVGVARK